MVARRIKHYPQAPTLTVTNARPRLRNRRATERLAPIAYHLEVIRTPLRNLLRQGLAPQELPPQPVASDV